MNYKLHFVSVPKYPDAESLTPGLLFSHEDILTMKMRQNRMSAYRFLAFWTWQDLARSERRPHSACCYAMVRATYPNDGQDYANDEHTLFEEELR